MSPPFLEPPSGELSKAGSFPDLSESHQGVSDGVSQQSLPGRNVLLSGAKSRPCKRPQFPSSLRRLTPKTCWFRRLSKKAVFRPAPNARKLCFRLHHRKRSHEEKCNRQTPESRAESLAQYGLHAFHSLPPLNECNPKKQAIHFGKTPPPPYCHWVLCLET